MDKLIFTALSGAEHTLRAQQVHANNLANMDTAGFRANMELASTQALGGYGYDDRHLSRMEADSVATRAGAVRETGRALGVLGAGDGRENELVHYRACISACIIELSVEMTFELAW